VAVAYRRYVFATVGPFDESFDACEDVELNHRVAKAGYKCLLSPSVRLRYYPRRTLAALFYQMMRYGRGRVRLLGKHPDTFSPACLAPALLVSGLALGPLVVAFLPAFAAAYWGGLSLYVIALAFFTCLASVSHKRAAYLALLPAVFLTIHLGAGAGMLREGLAQLTRSLRRAGAGDFPPSENDEREVKRRAA
jgi:succinoglycan biosynthesis protein ExoA